MCFICDGGTFEELALFDETVARIGSVNPGHWQTDRFNLWREYDRGGRPLPARAAVQLITDGEERLDRPPRLGR